jgi:hypothetical protein
VATALQIYNNALRLVGQNVLSATSDDDESRYAIDSVYSRAILNSLSLGWWKFAFTTASVTPTTSSTVPGYTHKFAKPSNWLRTHSVGFAASTEFVSVDYHEFGSDIYVKSATSIAIKYTKQSSTEIDPANWPEVFARVVEAHVAFEIAERLTQSSIKKADCAKILEERLGIARALESHAPPLLLPDHAVERVLRAQLESGLWKFAIKTVALTPNVATPSSGYTYAFDKPADWQRTVRVFTLSGSGASKTETEIDFLDENSDLHANYTPIYLRYIMTTGTTPSLWTDLFREAFEAGLLYQNALAEQLPDAAVQARYIQWQALIAQAKVKDALNERPKVIRSGSFNAARRGPWYNTEQGY